jgi:hypothetical protein
MDGCLTSVLSNSVLSNRISKLGLSRTLFGGPFMGSCGFVTNPAMAISQCGQAMFGHQGMVRV